MSKKSTPFRMRRSILHLALGGVIAAMYAALAMINIPISSLSMQLSPPQDPAPSSPASLSHSVCSVPETSGLHRGPAWSCSWKPEQAVSWGGHGLTSPPPLRKSVRTTKGTRADAPPM